MSKNLTEQTTRTIFQRNDSKEIDVTILDLLAGINKNSCDCSSCSVAVEGNIVDFLEEINRGGNK